MRESDYDKRYQRWGGLAKLAERYEADAAGELTLKAIGLAIGYSRQTVWNDIVRHLGRRPKRPRPRGRAAQVRRFEDPQGYLSSLGHALSPSVRRLIASAFSDFQADFIRPHGRRMALMSCRDRLAQIRVIPDKGRYTRVKITPGVSKYEVLYLIVDGPRGSRCLRYPSARVAHLKTLVISAGPRGSSMKHGGVGIG